MPIENERKFVLRLDFPAERLAGWRKHEIRQGYLDDGPRLRETDGAYLFTYKKWIPQTRELLEIETPVSHHDFELLWPQCVSTLQKTRYEKRIGDNDWVVDFLRRSSGDVYFAIAEVEMPRGIAAPDRIPNEIADYIALAVPAEDQRFTNKKLVDEKYAAGLYAEVCAQDAR